MSYIYTFLGWIMDWCYGVCGNYGWAIVLFTFITKIILLPVSLWTYFNGITMIKILPDMNYLKVKYYGQKDQIAEEQAKLFKEKKYSPFASIIPAFAQLFLLLGVVGVIRIGINNPSISMQFMSVNLGEVPAESGIRLVWAPIAAGLSALFLCVAQNASSVLQAEQSKLNKYGMVVFSVGLSLYLGWFVPVGTAFYWVCSNVMAVLQLYICNWIIRPKRYIDYERLEDSRKQLAEIQEVGKTKHESFFSENKKRERADYKRFFSIANKHLVFYSEGSGFYKYFKGIIEYLLNNTNVIIHYITSDPNDQIFEISKQYPRLKGYYIGENRLITLMMRMDADVVCMTMPDLDNFHIKRSYVRDDIEYIYIPHSMNSWNLTIRNAGLDHFDTIFCVGTHNVEEIKKGDQVYQLNPRKTIEYGSDLLDEMRREYATTLSFQNNDKKQIIIAPSWQKDNIIDLCLEEILDKLRPMGYKIIVRPHPQHVRHQGEYFEILKQKYTDDNIEIQTDFSITNSIWESNLLITDWSAIALEYSLTTMRPTLFINTPMKVMNPEYKKISIIPIDIEMRDKIGRNVDVDKLDQIPEIVDEMFEHFSDYKKRIEEWSKDKVFNPGCAAECGAQYIVSAIQDKISKRQG